MDSPVPACMFAPEPSSPGAARAAAAAARLHDGFDSDCSEDGEGLNGEPELDLTNKVGPGAGIGAKWDQVPKGSGGGPSRFLGDGGGGRRRARPPTGANCAEASRATGVPMQPPTAVLLPAAPTRPPAARLRGDHNPGSATWNPGARLRQRPARCHPLRYRRRPAPCPWQRGSAVAREDRVARSGAGRRLFLVSGKETESSRSVGEKGVSCLLCKATQNKMERGTRPVIPPSWAWNTTCVNAVTKDVSNRVLRAPEKVGRS